MISNDIHYEDPLGLQHCNLYVLYSLIEHEIKQRFYTKEPLERRLPYF